MVTPDVGRPGLAQATRAQIHFASVKKLRAFRNPVVQFQNRNSVRGVQPILLFKFRIAPGDLVSIGLPVIGRLNLRKNLMEFILKLCHRLEFLCL